MQLFVQTVPCDELKEPGWTPGARRSWSCNYLDDPTDGEGEDGEVNESWPISLVCLLNSGKQFIEACGTCKRP